ncbi:hypothetical protein H0H93_014813 [Arthromyces matolae]|nr:hypothetical protein H0H93_014813 [Arthromyces matolae]
MLDPTTIPHEILATVFEIGILTWDIRFLPPLRLVCHTWNEIVMTTPRLWGIISLDKWTDPDRLAYQISKAKHSPISIYVRRPNEVRSKALHMIVGLSSNWVHADVSTSMLKPGFSHTDKQKTKLKSSSIPKDTHFVPLRAFVS